MKQIYAVVVVVEVAEAVVILFIDDKNWIFIMN